ncbi:MAG: CHAT domain-containing protein [Comamonadaceae bacterium]|nr:CHAT domain-containing protein [Comamonadaceae bacterium]
MQANLQQQYFKVTRHLPAGLEAIQLFEGLAEAAPDDINSALMKHSLAMAAFSALALLGEDSLAALLQRLDIRHEAIAAAEKALEVLEVERTKTPQEKGLLYQIAKVQWIVGDLLRVGHSNDEERRRAIDALTKALADPTLERARGFAVRQSRAETIMALRDPSDEELTQAIEDLGEAARADQNDAAFDNQYLAYFAAGRLALRVSDWKQALPLLVSAATRAIAMVTAVDDEQALLIQAERAVQVLDATAVLYASVGWVDEALALTEVLRAVTMRRHVMDSDDRRAVVKEAQARVAERLMPAAVRSNVPIGGPSVGDLDDYLALDPIGPVVKRVLADPAAAGAAVVSLTRADDKMMALVCTLKGADEWVNETRTWTVEDAAIDTLGSGADIEASDERNDALARLGAAGYSTLIAPIADLLAKHEVCQLLLSVPGGLSGLPFEALSERADDPVLRIGTREVRCVLIPSLRLASDLLQRRRTLQARAQDALRVLVVGYHGDDLPDVGKELDALKAVWGTRLTAIEEDVTKHQVLNALCSDFDVLHIMGHATHNPVQPGASASASSTTMRSEIRAE